jgi:hypothetical protein
MTVPGIRRTTVMGVLSVAAVTLSVCVPSGAQAATPAPTRTTISTTTPSVVGGQAVKLKATVVVVAGTGSPTGTVTFREGTTVLAFATLALSGSTETARVSVTTLAIGSHTIIATYGGSATDASSTSLPLSVTVKPNASTTTVVATATATPGRTKLNTRVKVVLPGKGIPTGLVTYVIDGAAPQVVALDATGKAPLTVTFPVGSVHHVTATYGGSSSVLASSGTLTFTS